MTKLKSIKKNVNKKKTLYTYMNNMYSKNIFKSKQ